MEVDETDLTVIERRQSGMLSLTVIARDSKGSIWTTTDHGQGATGWKLVRSHEDIVLPTPSVWQVVEAANQGDDTIRLA